MQLPVYRQLVQALLSVALGVCLSVVYDVLRALRKRTRHLGVLLDALFCLIVFCALLLFALYAGCGELRLFMPPCIVLGTLVYFLTLSRLLLRLFVGCFWLLGLPLRGICILCKNLCKIFMETSKKLVAFAKKIIIMNSRKQVGAEKRRTRARPTAARLTRRRKTV